MEFQTARVEEVCDVTSSKRIYKADYQTDGVPFYRAKEISEKHKGVQQVSDQLFISRNKYEQIKSKFGAPVDGDLLLTSIGALLGEPYVVDGDGDFYFKDGNLTWFRNFRGINSRFLYYWLMSHEGKAQLQTAVIGSAQPAFTIAALKRMEVRLPSLSVQLRIASILSAYDDLIENNTRRIAILEEMARRLYEEWFVNFRFPGHEDAKMVESEIGTVPEGWSTLAVQNLLEHHIGGGWGKEEADETHTEPAYVIRGTDIPRAYLMSVDSCPYRLHKPTNLSKRVLKAGDIIFEVSGGSHDQSVGRALFVSNRLLSAFDGDVICASFCKRLSVIESKLSSFLFYLHLRTIYDNGHIDEFQVQSTGIINFQFKAFLEKEMLAIPPVSLQAQYLDFAVPLLDLAQVLGKQNSNLRIQRDFLLPKLISGEIDVSEAEQSIEKAAAE